MDERLAANRANWDARTPVHLASRSYDTEGWLADGRGPRPDEAQALGNVEGLRMVHLQCHIGLDTLAWARVGAEVVGLDFSPAERTVLLAGGLLAQVRTGGRSLLASDAVVHDDVAGVSQSRSAR